MNTKDKIVPMRKPTAPISLEAEQSVLGGLMQEQDKWTVVSKIIKESDFSEPSHKLIYAAMRALAEKQIPIDLITLATALEDAGLIDQVGNWAYLSRLERDTPSAANIDYYAIIVKIRSLERRREIALRKEDHDQAAVITAAIKKWREARLENRTHLMDIAEICSHPPVENWLIQHYLAADSLSVIFGDSACGKSFIAIDMAGHVAIGLPWRGCPTKAGPVLYVAGEGRNGLARRFKAWFEHHGEEPRNIVLSTISVQLTDAASMTTLVDEIRTLPALPKLIIVDTINRNFGPGDENSTADMTHAVANLDLLRTSTAATVLGLHHSGHGDKGRSRGSSVLRASLDCEYVAEKFDQTVQIRCTKAKDFDHPPPLAWVLEKQSLPWADEEGNPLNSAVLIPRELPAPPAPPITAQMGANQVKAIELLRQLYYQNQVRLEASGISPVHAKVSKTDWYAAMEQAGFPKNRRTDTKVDLVRRRLIQEEGDYVFLTEIPFRAVPE